MGFPQGSILGPLLFLIYVNDFNNCLTKSKAVMFADDTTVWTSHKNTSTLFQFMQSEMELIDRWLVSNKLSINIEKSKFMLFSTPNSNVGGKHSLSIRNRQIDQVNSLKFLGVFIHNNLSWSLHMKYLISKLRSCYGVVCKIKSLVNRGAPSLPKKGADRISTFFQTWGSKAPHTPPGFFLITAYFSKLYERARCSAPSQRLHCVLQNC